jgi:hypothetical protein
MTPRVKKFGPVTVTKIDKKPAIISAPEQVLNVTSAEAFWGNLMDAITTARELDGDPV